MLVDTFPGELDDDESRQPAAPHKVYQGRHDLLRNSVLGRI